MFVSFCEVSTNSVRRLINSLDSHKYKESCVFIGSDFCYRKLYSLKYSHIREIMDSVHALDGKLIFVFPIIPEIEIEHFHRFVSFLFEISIDGIVINDYGAMYYIHKFYPDIPLSLGRLLVKNCRDYSSKKNDSFRFPSEIDHLVSQYDIHHIHLDLDIKTTKMSNAITITHGYKYISSSMRCEYKKSPLFDSYTVDGKCDFECLYQHIRIGNSGVFRIGNTIICQNDNESPTLKEIGIDSLLKHHIHEGNGST